MYKESIKSAGEKMDKTIAGIRKDMSTLRAGRAKGVRFGTINRICYFLQCDVGDLLKFDGNLEEVDENEA